MQLLSKIGSVIFGGLIMLGIGLFLACGVIVIALWDGIKFLARHEEARMRGDRYRRFRPPSTQYDFPHLIMDANGFVEPPQQPTPYYSAATRTNRSLAVSATPAPRRPGVLAVNLQLEPKFGTILQFPADPAVRAAYAARRASSSTAAVMVARGPKVVYLSPYRHGKKR